MPNKNSSSAHMSASNTATSSSPVLGWFSASQKAKYSIRSAAPGPIERFRICQQPDDSRVYNACESGCNGWSHLECLGLSCTAALKIESCQCFNCRDTKTLEKSLGSITNASDSLSLETRDLSARSLDLNLTHHSQSSTAIQQQQDTRFDYGSQASSDKSQAQTPISISPQTLAILLLRVLILALNCLIAILSLAISQKLRSTSCWIQISPTSAILLLQILTLTLNRLIVILSSATFQSLRSTSY